MGIQGNRYQLNERINELECKMKKVEEENEKLKMNKGIKLKNIDLTGISIEQQTQKVTEEDNELIKAIVNRDKDNAIEEFWDCVQVRLGALDIAMEIKAEEVMEGYPRHLEKLKNRPRKKDIENENR